MSNLSTNNHTDENLPSLIKKDEPVRAVPVATPRKDAEKWFAVGHKKHQDFERSLKQARRDMVDAAFAFLRCRSAFEHGAWGEFLMLHTSVTPRTVNSYIKLARHAQDWAMRSNPAAKTIEEINAIARDMVIHSPKPMVELCRELEVMRPFGEYDSIKYATKKISGAQQIEFSFEKVSSSLDLLAHLDDANYVMNFGEGQDETAALEQLEEKLETALKTLRARKTARATIEA